MAIHILHVLFIYMQENHHYLFDGHALDPTHCMMFQQNYFAIK